MQLSENFSLAEMTRSQLAARHKIDNTPPPEVVEELRKTAAMLQRVRSFLWEQAGFECPIFVTSGYRAPQLNALLGSRSTSDHTKGAAADIVVPAFGPAGAVFAALAPRVRELGVGQLILEFPGPTAWLHLSTREPAEAHNRVLVYDGAAYTAVAPKKAAQYA